MSRTNEDDGLRPRGRRVLRKIDKTVSHYGHLLERGVKRLIPRPIRAGLRWLDRNFERYVMIVMLTLVVVIVSHEVFRRFVLEDATRWGVQTATYLYVILSWIGASYAVQKRIHLKIDIVQRNLPNDARFLVVIGSNILFIILMLVLIRYLSDIVTLQRELGRTMFGFRSVVTWPFYAAAVFGMILMVVRLIQVTIGDYKLYTNEGRFAESEALFVDKDESTKSDSSVD